jgi:glycine betaine/proline transport system permease protein
VAVASERLGAVAAAPSARWRGRGVQVAGVVLVMLVAFAALRGEYPWPLSLTWQSLPERLDDLQVWLLDERTAVDPSPIFALFDGFRALADWLVTAITDLLLWMTWVGTTAAGVLIVLRFGGVRVAFGVLAAFVSFAVMGLWEESIQTLALMLAAVSLSLLVGMPIGIAAGRSPRVLAAITPILDAMQIVPAFAYLMPVVILFSVGPAAAVICTMIYAVPPAVRITALGIRGVTRETVEASTALGATAAQTLAKVELPLARRQLLLAVNQTIMFALSLTVIAGLIGGRGLGDVVTNGLYSNPALALLAGVAIVIMAITLDRASAAIADRTDPTRRHLTDEGRRRVRLATLGTFGAIAAIVLVARALGVQDIYPDEFETATTLYTATLNDQLLSAIQSVLDYVQDPASFIFGITEPIGNFLVEYALEPIRVFLVDTPWLVTLAALTLVALLLSGLRPAVTTFLMLSAIGIMGVWEPAMDTASQVLVATAIAVAIGIAVGIWAAESPRAEKAMRPVLDTLQTLPQLVYIIPFIYLMPVSRVPGVVASVLYAVPVVIRLVANGLRTVPSAAVESASAFGATRRQLLAKVKLPLARDAIMLGVNQGMIMVLAVVVIGGLVGSGALGDMVARGLQRNEFGEGVVASLAILALGIALDRVTQGRRTARSDRPGRRPQRGWGVFRRGQALPQGGNTA